MHEASLDHLVRRAGQDSEALGKLYDRYYGRILAYCARRLFFRDLAEDLTATVFLHVAGRIRAFEGETEEDFRKWLYVIATNEINNYVRITQRRERLLEAARQERLRLEATRMNGDEDHQRLDWPRLYEAILELAPRDQAVIVLRFWEGLKHAAIAEVLGCSWGHG